MKMTKKSAVLASVLATTIAGLSPAVAQAAPANGVVVGPGSPMRMPIEGEKVVEGRHVGAAMCSLGVPGTIIDQNGNKQRVILTAGHCLVPPSVDEEVKLTGKWYIPTREGDVLLGEKVVATDVLAQAEAMDVEGVRALLENLFNTPDYGVIEVHPDVVTTGRSESVSEFGRVKGEPVQIVGIQDNRTLAPFEVSGDNFGQPICSDGSRSGRSCGFQLFRVRHGVWALMPIDNGDSGGNVYNPQTREAIGVNSMGIGPLTRAQPIDVALEETYGIPDGQVNDRFQVETNTQAHTPTRTIQEDSRFSAEQKRKEAQNEMGSTLGDLIPGLDLPSPQLPIPSPKLPIPSADLLPGVNDVMAQAGLPTL